ncbi:hypothetical protein V5799_013193 [Amblyomma americanum]|uniref:Monocarboxylate transporter n=1 Tax=Amblyomma americanum TaxID=6943 RepID=A0AAQ4E6R2_AMBAM
MKSLNMLSSAGTGQGIIFNCSVIGLGDQFDSWRGLALGVVMTGAFRDTLGSYNDLFFVMASALIVGFALFAGLLAWDIFKRKTFVVSRQ